MRRLLVAALALLACLVGPEAARAQRKDRVTLAVGGTGASVYLQVDVARALGLFEQEGLDADVQYFQGGSPAATALIGGAADFSTNAIDQVLKARAQGKGVTMISAFTELPGLVLVVHEKHKGQVKSPKDLKAKTLGVSAPASATDILLTYILNQHGVRRDEVSIIGAGTNTFPAALRGGKIDGGMTLDPFATQIVNEGYGYVLVDLRTEAGTRQAFGGPYMFTGLVTRDEVMQQKPQVVQKMVNVFVKATRWMAQRSAEQIAEVLPADLVKDRRSYAASLAPSKEIFSKTGKIPPAGIDAVFKAGEVFQPGNEELKRVKPDELYTNRFVDAAAK
jgi:NitT/TauT family transport system substrate-binding protein